MIQTTQIQFHFSPLTWAQLLFLIFQPRAAAQSAVQPVPSFASHQNWDPSIAAMVGALFCAFLFMGFFSVYLRHCSDAHIAAASERRCSCSEGIDRKVLDTFPVLVYSTIKDHKMGKFALECAVCLNEFKDNETLRLLPKCNHVFHPACIQAWLSSHVTCPVCREKLNPDLAQVAITLPTEGRDEHGRTEQHQNFQGQSGMDSGNDGTVTVHEAPVKSGRFGELARSNSTGHCEVEGRGTDRDGYTLRLPEDVRKYVLLNHGSMRRSASYNVITPMCRNESQGLQNDHVSHTA